MSKTETMGLDDYTMNDLRHVTRTLGALARTDAAPEIKLHPTYTAEYLRAASNPKLAVIWGAMERECGIAHDRANDLQERADHRHSLAQAGSTAVVMGAAFGAVNAGVRMTYAQEGQSPLAEVPQTKALGLGSDVMLVPSVIMAAAGLMINYGFSRAARKIKQEASTIMARGQIAALNRDAVADVLDKRIDATEWRRMIANGDVPTFGNK